MVLSLTHELRSRGWETPVLVIGDGSFSEELMHRDYEVLPVTSHSAPSITGSTLGKLARVAELAWYHRRIVPAVAAAADRVGADVHHLLWPNLLSVVSAAGSRRRVPTLWEMPNIVGAGWPFELNARLLRRTIRRNGVVALPPSAYVAKTLAAPDATEVLPFGVDADRFSPWQQPGYSRTHLQIPSEAPVVGIVARLDRTKGQHLAISALAELHRRGTDLHLIIAGTGSKEFTTSLREMATRLGVDRACHFVGAVSQPEHLYPVIDVALNLRIDPEPFGLSVIEAMAAGTPVLAHARGGPAETVLDGVTGWHIKEASVTAVTLGLQRVLGAREHWASIGRHARAHVLGHYTVQRQADRYSEIALRARGWH